MPRRKVPLSPKPPVLPKPPNRDIRVVRRSREAIRNAIKMVKKHGVSPASQAELKELLEAVRSAGYAEGYAAAKMEAAMALATPAEEEEVAPPRPQEPQKRLDLSDTPYVSRTTFNATRALALDYLKAVSRAVGPTEIIKNTHRTTGTRLTMTTLRRALDDLVHAGDVEQVDNSRWQIKGAARPVPLRPVR